MPAGAPQGRRHAPAQLSCCLRQPHRRSWFKWRVHHVLWDTTSRRPAAGTPCRDGTLRAPAASPCAPDGPPPAGNLPRLGVPHWVGSLRAWLPSRYAPEADRVARRVLWVGCACPARDGRRQRDDWRAEPRGPQPSVACRWRLVRARTAWVAHRHAAHRPGHAWCRPTGGTRCTVAGFRDAVPAGRAPAAGADPPVRGGRMDGIHAGPAARAVWSAAGELAGGTGLRRVPSAD